VTGDRAISCPLSLVSCSLKTWCFRQDSNLHNAPGLGRLPLPVGLRKRWSGRRALLPPPPAWRAGALLNELLPGWRLGLHRHLRLKAPERSAAPLRVKRVNGGVQVAQAVVPALPLSYSRLFGEAGVEPATWCISGVYARGIGARRHSMVDLAGFEPTASAMPLRRASNRATSPS